LVHGPVEALFTIDEETGMTGANALKGGILKGDILINLDSETEGELYVGCAGGLDAEATFKYTSEAVEKGYETYAITVKGLRGGHSGMEINEGRGNSNKITTRMVLPIVRDLKGQLVSFNGGNMRNAIPREAFAEISIDPKNVNKAKAIVKKVTAEVKNEYALIEPNIEIRFEKVAKAKKQSLRKLHCVH
jgi:dipeptidase D